MGWRCALQGLSRRRGYRLIITRTPYRMSFLGGGTDYFSWYSEHGGMVLTTTIDKYVHICARFMPPYLGHRYRIIWAQFEKCDSRDEIKHPGVRGCLEYMQIDEGFEVNHAGDLPARSGLGSSSAFTVGMLHALHALTKSHASKRELADQAIFVEQSVLKETVGIQDQIQCAHGGLNVIEIRRNGSYDVQPLRLPDARQRELEAHCLLFFTGLQRNASDVLNDMRRNAAIDEMLLAGSATLARRGVKALVEGEIREFGALLHEGWVLKCALSNLVSTPEINEMYQRALDAGALGGKLLGAGSGGFLLIFARPPEHQAVREAVGLMEVPVRFESSGTQLIHAS